MWLHRFAALVAAGTFVLLIAGGLVTSTDSGLAVPDWPLAYGMWFPPMVGGILYEHGHRIVAAAVGLCILILATWVGRTEHRPWVRRLAIAALGAVVTQGLLGGMTVLLLLPPEISIAHAMLGQVTFCLVVALTVALSPRWVEHPPITPDDPPLRLLIMLTACSAAVQLFLGAVLRHTGIGLVLHLAGAALVAALVFTVGRRVRQQTPPPVIHGGSVRLHVLVGVQLVLGLLTWLLPGHVALVTSHVAMGALVLAQSVMLAWHAGRRFGPAPSAESGASDVAAGAV